MRPPLTMHSAMTMNLTIKYGSRRSQQPDNVNFEPIIRGLKVIFLTETKCKIRIIYVRFNCKRKKWGKKWMEIMSIKRGNGKFHLKFPFCFSEYLPKHV